MTTDATSAELRSVPSGTFSPRKHIERGVVDDNASSSHSQDGSSIYGSCGYFYRFSEKSSPFDGGFDEAMLEEDILAGIVDESSCYFSEESEEEQATYARNANATTTFALNINQLNDIQQQNFDNLSIKGSTRDDITQCPVIVNNSSLNVLRCVGRYLQMCKLLHSISPYIVASMAELIDFYTYVVHDVFGRDMVSSLKVIKKNNLCVIKN